MELALNGNFNELSFDELFEIDGGIDWDAVGQTVAGAAGAAIGAKIGTVFSPGVGTTIGGIIGGAVGVIVYTFFD